MTADEPRKRRPTGEPRRLILAAARDLFSRRGYSDTSTRELADRAVNEVSRDGDQIRRQRVGVRHDLVDERPTDGRPHVNVGELDDAEAAKRFGKMIDANAMVGDLELIAHAA